MIACLDTQASFRISCVGGKEKTVYSEPGDWVLASFRLKGKQPRVANMLVEDYLRPAAAKAGIL